jgi:hypothetical protein
VRVGPRKLETKVNFVFGSGVLIGDVGVLRSSRFMCKGR